MKRSGARTALLACLALSLPLGASRAAPVSCDGPLAPCLIDEAVVIADDVPRAFARDEAWFAIADALADMSRIDAALDAADRVENALMREEVLGEIAIAMARLGQFDRAVEIALAMLDSRNRSSRVMTLEKLAAEQAIAGRIDDAFDTVTAINNPYRRSQAQAAIAAAVARTGNIPVAIRTATRIATDYWFTSDQHQLKVASGLVSRSGEFDQFWFYEALANIAVIQAREGDILGGLQTAKSIPDVGGRSRAKAGIAAVQAENGDVPGALETARRIEIAYGDRDAMVAVAKAKAATGDFDAALDLAHDIVSAYGDYSAIVGVAALQARLQGAEAGLETAAGVDNLQVRALVHTEIAEVLARTDRPDDAIRALALITDPEDRATANERVAVALAESGLVDRALALAEAYASPREYDDLVIAISVAQARAGDAEGAIETAFLSEDGMSRAIALAGIAREAAR